MSSETKHGDEKRENEKKSKLEGMQMQRQKKKLRGTRAGSIKLTRKREAERRCVLQGDQPRAGSEFFTPGAALGGTQLTCSPHCSQGHAARGPRSPALDLDLVPVQEGSLQGL